MDIGPLTDEQDRYVPVRVDRSLLDPCGECPKGKCDQCGPCRLYAQEYGRRPGAYLPPLPPPDLPVTDPRWRHPNLPDREQWLATVHDWWSSVRRRLRPEVESQSQELTVDPCRDGHDEYIGTTGRGLVQWWYCRRACGWTAIRKGAG